MQTTRLPEPQPYLGQMPRVNLQCKSIILSLFDCCEVKESQDNEQTLAVLMQNIHISH